MGTELEFQASGAVAQRHIIRSLEHTLLKAEALPSHIDRVCDEATAYQFAGVCVNPVYVKRAAARLWKPNDPRVITVIGFPLGASTVDIKREEALRALDDGACELDLVPYLGNLIAGNFEWFQNEVRAIAEVAHRFSSLRILKVILETALLDSDRIKAACKHCEIAGANFVKTSTGMHPAGGATIEHVQLLRHHAGAMGVKAAGGIRTAEQARAFVEAGASRIGTSSSVAIAEELCKEHDLPSL